MFSEKRQVDSQLDLSLYIEGLLNIPEEDVAPENIVVEKALEKIVEVEHVEKSDNIKTEQSIQSKIPEWGQQPFKSLLVKLAGMDLMIPAMTVSFIEKINRKITRTPLEVEACKGIITLREKSIVVIDLLSLISENIASDDSTPLQVEENNFNYVLVMEEASYALACEDVSQMITLEPEDVRWNNAAFNNPMFSGVVPEYLCPIINLVGLNKQVSAMPFVRSVNERNN